MTEPMTTQPSVSIIVPCFDVAPYLDECVRSAVGQTYQRVQVVLVDDGSTDETPELVDAWAARDSRVIGIHQSNGGLGAARNAGIDAADGDYLCFLDSDDVLPRDAIARMVASGETTGSDIVSGVAMRFDDRDEWRSNLYRPIFDSSPSRTHIFQEPSLVYDQMACSKLFRRSFWDEHAFEFPVGVLFEDVRVVMEAHCRAKAVDLLAEPTYRWRSRDDSITGDRMRPGSISARFQAVADVDGFFRDHAPPIVWQHHGSKVFEVEIRLYSRLLERASDESASEFFRSAGPVVASLDPLAISSLNPVMSQLRAYLIAGDRIGVMACASLFSGHDGRPLAQALKGASQLLFHDPRAALRLAVASARYASKSKARRSP